MILKISLRAKGGVPKTLLEQKHRLNFLYFPQNTLMLTESREEFSDLDSIFRLRALRYCIRHGRNTTYEPGLTVQDEDQLWKNQNPKSFRILVQFFLVYPFNTTVERLSNSSLPLSSCQMAINYGAGVGAFQRGSN